MVMGREKGQQISFWQGLGWQSWKYGQHVRHSPVASTRIRLLEYGTEKMVVDVQGVRAQSITLCSIATSS